MSDFLGPIKTGLTVSNTQPEISSEQPGTPQSPGNSGIGGVRDGLEAPQDNLFAAAAGSAQALQEGHQETAQLANDAAKAFLRLVSQQNPDLNIEEFRSMTQADVNAVSSSLSVAAASCASIPMGGPIIAAALAVIATIIVMVHEIENQDKNQAAAQKEQQATQNQINANTIRSIKLIP